MDYLKELGIEAKNKGTYGNKVMEGSGWMASTSPADGKLIGELELTTREAYETLIAEATDAQKHWRTVPAPERGEIVRIFGERLREKKEALGTLVSYEMGKSLQEGLGEVQEIIDICDFAVGLSRQLYGLTMHSERPEHRMYEQWHPLGIVGIITAFNFPVAVWGWNVALAWVCGNVTVWKPSEKSPLSAIAIQNIISEVLEENNLPGSISCLINGDAESGKWMTADKRIALISATGSTRMGKAVGADVAARLGRSLLELGGNNAIIISKHADLDLSIRGALFGAVGTCGQRCTSTRRLIIHKDVYEEFRDKLVAAYSQLNIGDPLDQNNHVGPLIDTDAVAMYESAIEKIAEQGGKMVTEYGKLVGPGFESGCYVRPCIAEVTPDMEIVKEETFAPILYLMTYTDLEEAINIQNNVPQGLSSAIMTNDLREAEGFLSVNGSDCGIANVNIGTSGAEIGGAFGGEKETGGGRESGSDSWKAYMRRQTNTINYGTDIPLAQGIKFDL